MIGAGEVIVLAVAEIGEADVGEFILRIGKAQPQLGLRAVRFLLLEVPLAFLAPAEADRAIRHDDRTGLLVVGDGLPFGVVGLAEVVGEVGGAQQPVGH